MKEKALLYHKMPFGVTPYHHLEMEDKGCLIDEKLCHELDIPVKNFVYQRFTLLPGIKTRCVGFVKISVQEIQRG